MKTKNLLDKIRSGLFCIGLGTSIIIDGCEDKKGYDVVAEGKPLSAVYKNIFSIAFDADGKAVLCRGSFGIYNSDAAALIQAEINDRDDELIKFYGDYFIDDRGTKLLKISSIRNNNYHINNSGIYKIDAESKVKK